MHAIAAAVGVWKLALVLSFNRIAGRLTGTLLGILSIPSLPLSVEGQVHRLIEEATDKENLGKMYVWWMAWF